MITLKSPHEIELMRRAGKITAAARALARDMVKPGVTTAQIDKAVFQFIKEQGATPSFLHYNGYPASVCVSVNDEIIQRRRGGVHRRFPRRLRRHLSLWSGVRRGAAADPGDAAELL